MLHFKLENKADLPAPRINFRSTPDNRRSLADAGFRPIYFRLTDLTLCTLAFDNSVSTAESNADVAVL